MSELWQAVFRAIRDRRFKPTAEVVDIEAVRRRVADRHVSQTQWVNSLQPTAPAVFDGAEWKRLEENIARLERLAQRNRELAGEIRTGFGELPASRPEARGL